MTTDNSLPRSILDCAADAAHLARCDVVPWLWYRIAPDGSAELAATRLHELPSRVGQGWSLLLPHPVPTDVPWSLYPEFIGRRVALISHPAPESP